MAFEIEGLGAPFSTVLLAIPIMQAIRGMNTIKLIEDQNFIVTANAVVDAVDATIVDNE